jgi:hypothetical protein
LEYKERIWNSFIWIMDSYLYHLKVTNSYIISLVVKILELLKKWA